MKKIVVVMALLIGMQQAAQAQSWGYGFKVGLNTSGVFGPSEVSDEGEDLETFGTIGGFQVGALVQYRFNKYVGVQLDLLFSQKGTDYKYDGPSYEAYTSAIGASLPSTGERLVLINATNGHFNIPVMAFVNVTKKFNVGLGMYADILVSSSATGETQYSGVLDNGSGEVEVHLLNYDYNYLRDEAGEAAGASTLTVLVGSENVTLPLTEGAYYDWAEKQGSYYNRFDYGLVGNLGWRFNNGLRFDARINYGLTDVTNNYYDVALKSRDADGNPIPRTDFDRSISYQFSIGFGF